MEPGRALQSCYLSGRKHVFASGPGQWREGVNLFWGFGGSSVPDLEEEGLEGGSHFRKPHLWGGREEAHLLGRNRGLRV